MFRGSLGLTPELVPERGAVCHPGKKCSLPGKAAGLILSMPLSPVRSEDESGKMLHACVSSLEGPSLASSAWGG